MDWIMDDVGRIALGAAAALWIAYWLYLVWKA